MSALVKLWIGWGLTHTDRLIRHCCGREKLSILRLCCTLFPNHGSTSDALAAHEGHHRIRFPPQSRYNKNQKKASVDRGFGSVRIHVDPPSLLIDRRCSCDVGDRLLSRLIRLSCFGYSNTISKKADLMEMQLSVITR